MSKLTKNQVLTIALFNQKLFGGTFEDSMEETLVSMMDRGYECCPNCSVIFTPNTMGASGGFCCMACSEEYHKLINSLIAIKS